MWNTWVTPQNNRKSATIPDVYSCYSLPLLCAIHRDPQNRSLILFTSIHRCYAGGICGLAGHVSTVCYIKYGVRGGGSRIEFDKVQLWSCRSCRIRGWRTDGRTATDPRKDLVGATTRRRRIPEDLGAQIEIQNYPECNLLKWVFNILCRRRAKNMEFYIQNSIKFPISRKSYPDDGRWRWSSGQMVIGLVQCIAQWLTTRHASAPPVFSLPLSPHHWDPSRPHVHMWSMDLSLHCDRFEWPAVVVGDGGGRDEDIIWNQRLVRFKISSSGMLQSEEELFAIGKWFAHFALYKLLPAFSSFFFFFFISLLQLSNHRPSDRPGGLSYSSWSSLLNGNR